VSDDELVELAQGGSRAAFGELVERHQQAVFRTALAALRSREEAEELVQDTLVAAFHELHRFRGASSFRTWLLAIAWNRARDRRRLLSRWARVFISRDGAGRPEPAAAGLSQEEALIDAESDEAVRALIGTLPAKYRDALLLSAITGQTFDEIAGLLGVPVGTAKWRAMEGRRLLRAKLVRRGFGPAGGTGRR
jgi:RNA polymerase sigma-70 factor (ECF subfamily)